MDLTSVEDVFEALKPVMDPEHPISITAPEMSIVTTEFIKVDDDLITVRFKPTTPYCPMGGLIGILIRHRLETVYPESKVVVKLIPGSHSQEDAVNLMINNKTKYSNIVKQLEDRGML
jgi:metal-sulfur cluster biosynthetic enzyme